MPVADALHLEVIFCDNPTAPDSAYWREQAIGVLLRLTILVALPVVVLEIQNQRIFPSIIYSYLLLIALVFVRRVSHQMPPSGAGATA